MELTPKELEWRRRLIEMAGQASDDGLPCIEQTCVVLVRILELPRTRQLIFSEMMHSLVTLLQPD